MVNSFEWWLINAEWWLLLTSADQCGQNTGIVWKLRLLAEIKQEPLKFIKVEKQISIHVKGCWILEMRKSAMIHLMTPN